jgi:hypothetical protein
MNSNVADFPRKLCQLCDRPAETYIYQSEENEKADLIKCEGLTYDKVF